MQIKVTAEDETSRSVYSETTSGDFLCHLCNIALCGKDKLFNHNSCNQHKMKLEDRPYSTQLWLQKAGSFEKNFNSSGNIVAPESYLLPRTAVIQTTLDLHETSPLVGLEYVLELDNPESKEPNYNCVLCDKRGDPRTFLAHLVSYNHRIAYLNRHFPTISRALVDLPRTANYKRGASEISILATKAIEQHFGRLKPQVVDKKLFEQNRIQIIKQVYQGHHFR